MPRVPDRAAARLQYALPKQAMTSFAGRVASARRGPSTTRLIRWFIARYGVDMSEAVDPDPASYATFNDFFTRALKPGARPIEKAELICPVDGAISQFGAIDRDQIFQAKGHHYTTTALVGGDADAGRALRGRPVCDAVPQPARLSPHPHAVRRRA